jgi:hypothetical protein
MLVVDYNSEATKKLETTLSRPLSPTGTALDSVAIITISRSGQGFQRIIAALSLNGTFSHGSGEIPPQGLRASLLVPDFWDRVMPLPL